MNAVPASMAARNGTHSTRRIAPADAFVAEASDYLVSIFIQRPNPEVRGFLNGPGKVDQKVIDDSTGSKGGKG